MANKLVLAGRPNLATASSPLLAIALSATAVSMPAAAQESDWSGALEEVIVTANRREQSLQEVPMSVTAFTGEFFQDTGITDFSNIDEYTPSLKITPGLIHARPRSAFAVSVRWEPTQVSIPAWACSLTGSIRAELG